MDSEEVYKAALDAINDEEEVTIRDILDEYPKGLLGEYYKYVVDEQEPVADKYIGMGGLGFAVMCNDEKNLIKFSIDRTEYEFAKHCHKVKDYSNNVVKVEKASMINVGDVKLYLIMKEYAISLSKKEREEIHKIKSKQFFNQYHGLLEEYFRIKIQSKKPRAGAMEIYRETEEIKNKINYREIFNKYVVGNKTAEGFIEKHASEAMKNHIQYLEDGKINGLSEKGKRFVKEMLRMAKEEGVFFYDISRNNVGKREFSGEYCLFDFGQVAF